MASPVQTQTVQTGCSACRSLSHKRPNHRDCPHNKGRLGRRRKSAPAPKKPRMQTGWNKFSTLRRAELKALGLSFADCQSQAGKEWKEWKADAISFLGSNSNHKLCDESEALKRLVFGEFDFKVERGPRSKPAPSPQSRPTEPPHGDLADLIAEAATAFDAAAATTAAAAEAAADDSMAFSAPDSGCASAPNLRRMEVAHLTGKQSTRRKKFLCAECNATVKVYPDDDGDFFCPTCNYELI